MEIAVGSRPGVPRGSDEAYVAEIVAPGIVLLAVAHGFGRIRERPASAVAAQSIRDNLKHRVRRERRDPPSRPPTHASTRTRGAPTISSPRGRRSPPR